MRKIKIVKNRQYIFKGFRNILASVDSRIHQRIGLEKILAGGIFLVVGLKCISFVGVYFPCPDDMSFASYPFFNGGILQAALKQAESQSRFYQVIYVPLSEIPYLFHTLTALWIIRILLTLFFVGTLYYFLLQTTKNRIMTRAVLLIFVSLFYFGGWYNSISTEPFWFGFADSLAFIGFGMLQSIDFTKCSTSQLRKVIGMALVMAAALSYEIMMILPIVYLLLLWKKQSRVYRPNKSKSFLTLNLGLTIATLIYYLSYFIAYFMFSHKYKSHYSGTAITLGSPKEIITTDFKMSVAGFRALKYFNKLSIHTWAHYWYLDLVSLFITMLILAVFAKKTVMKTFYFNKWIIAGCIVFAFYFNIGYALTERYRSRTKIDSMYLEASLSSALLILGAFLLFVRIMLKSKRYIYHFFILISGLTIFLGTACNFILYNQEESFLRASGNTWKIVDYLCQNQQKWTVGGPINLVSPGLFALTPRHDANYWTYYFSSSIHKKIHVTMTSSEAMKNEYLFVYINNKDAIFFISERSNINVKNNIIYSGILSHKEKFTISELRFIGLNKVMFHNKIYKLAKF